MDRSILKKYDALKEEQADIGNRITQLENQMNQLLCSQVSDTVTGTRPDGTYGPIKIKGIPFPEYDQKKEQLQKRLDQYAEIEKKLAGMVSDIEDFILTIPEPRIRTILRLRYLDGKTWREVGRHYGKAHQWAYNKVERYFSKSACKEENVDVN